MFIFVAVRTQIFILMKHFLLLFLVPVSLLWAQSPPAADAISSLHPELFNLTKNKVAVEGYDLTTYFSQDKPLKGTEKWKSSYSGVTFYFANEANKKTFDATPEKFIPEFGGWCAYAIGAYDKKVEINPESYTIEDGKLYLFYKTRFNDTRKKWLNDHQSLKSKAYKNWVGKTNQ